MQRQLSVMSQPATDSSIHHYHTALSAFDGCSATAVCTIRLSRYQLSRRRVALRIHPAKMPSLRQLQLIAIEVAYRLVFVLTACIAYLRSIVIICAQDDGRAATRRGRATSDLSPIPLPQARAVSGQHFMPVYLLQSITVSRTCDEHSGRTKLNCH